MQSALTASPISNASNSSMQCAYWSRGMGNGIITLFLYTKRGYHVCMFLRVIIIQILIMCFI